MILSLREFQELGRPSDDITRDMNNLENDSSKENLMTGFIYPGNYIILNTERDSFVFVSDDSDWESQSRESVEEEIYFNHYIRTVQEIEVPETMTLGDGTKIYSSHEFNDELQSLTSMMNLMIQITNNEMNDSNKEGFDFIGFQSSMIDSIEDEMIRLGYRTRV